MNWGLLRWPLVKLLMWLVSGLVLVAVTTSLILVISPRISGLLALKPEDFLHTLEAAALIVAAVQIVMMYGLSRSEAKWRKLLSYHKFFGDCPAASHRQAMMALLHEEGCDDVFIGVGSPLKEPNLTAIYTSPSKLQTIRLYLDGFEQLSAAIDCGVVDKDYVFETEGGRIVRAFKVFGPLIGKMKQVNSLAYIQFEELAEDWEIRRNAEVASESARVKKSRRSRRQKVPG